MLGLQRSLLTDDATFVPSGAMRANAGKFGVCLTVPSVRHTHRIGNLLPKDQGSDVVSVGMRIMADAGVVPREIQLKKDLDALRAELKTASAADPNGIMRKLADVEMRHSIEQEARCKFYRTSQGLWFLEAKGRLLPFQTYIGLSCSTDLSLGDVTGACNTAFPSVIHFYTSWKMRVRLHFSKDKVAEKCRLNPFGARSGSNTFLCDKANHNPTLWDRAVSIQIK
jgi:hypothetical protein